MRKIQIDTMPMDITTLFWPFQSHLSIPNNNRIFLSGKFWTWKSYFLKEFFKQTTSNYQVFHLYPTNYQISSNDDIFEYIKYDLLVNLYQENDQIFSSKEYGEIASMEHLIHGWLMPNKMNIAKSIFNCLWDLWKPLIEITGLLGNFHEYYKTDKGGEKKKITDFLERIKREKPWETDYLSQLIKEKIELLKGNKESILVLDDLDRLDPEHMFRLLNIFSAHFYDNKEDGVLKFWFDKVILVGDIENLKSIFYHRYWRSADFIWYIDKFYSIGIYPFSTQKLAFNFVEEVLEKAQYDKVVHSNSMTTRGYIYMLLNDILSRSIRLSRENRINMRNLLRICKYKLVSLQKGAMTVKDDKDFLDRWLNTLIDIFGWDKEHFMNVLQEILIKDTRNAGKMDKTAYRFFGYKFLSWYFYAEKGNRLKDDYKWVILGYDIECGLSAYDWDLTIVNCGISIKRTIDEELVIRSQIWDIEEILRQFFFTLLIDYLKKDVHETKSK